LADRQAIKDLSLEARNAANQSSISRSPRELLAKRCRQGRMTTPAPNSLRKKNRNADALPRRQSSFPPIPENAAATGPMPPPPRVRPRDKSKVESMMKRRYSTRGMPPPAAVLEPFPEELMQKTKVPEPGIVEKVIFILKSLRCSG